MSVDEASTRMAPALGGAPPPPTSTTPSAATRWRRALSFRNVGALYVWLILIVVFSFWAPETFPHWDTVRQVLNGNAVTALVALSLVIPLSAGVFDLSIGYALGLCNVLLAYLIVRAGMGVDLALLLTLVAALAIGVVNAVVVVVFRIDSFIGTLATGSLLLAGVTFVSGNSEIVGSELTHGFFSDIANTQIGGISLSVLYMLIVAVVIWFVLEHTVSGRWLYASGFNADAARLAGIPVRRLRFIGLVVSAIIAGGIAGITVSSQIGSGSTTVGPPYLLNAFAAAFLGATQLRQGRFNAWGTLIAVLMLGTGTAGLGLAGAPVWAPDVFTGVVLLAALAVTRAERNAAMG
ncbi:ABC transporter permease [Conexibacter sp. CPCC 206217]|uniref:ABC transporter permease n=1 Tax=Conexibacter sp. CPCC 206217 TaxID=3064574 RepID=UPI0027237212|nr:ABC transporter permease [Conexibacter sp. CPCC 206217]MDO8212574.1 ABC transporter permease [Conexibacter sp. CPCC 206217]